MNNKELKRRILEISYKNKLSHLGSCLTAVDIIDEIYSIKRVDDKFVLSSGHAGLALYTVLEKYNLGKLEPLDAEKIFEHHGVHPDRCKECHLDCSSGSLGQGLPIALGMALADRTKNVYCLISDGECNEGSISEAFRIWHEFALFNLKIYLNFNGWGAYSKIDPNRGKFLESYGIQVRYTNVNQLPFLNGQEAHYKVMNEEEYKIAMEATK